VISKPLQDQFEWSISNILTCDDAHVSRVVESELSIKLDIDESLVKSLAMWLGKDYGTEEFDCSKCIARIDSFERKIRELPKMLLIFAKTTDHDQFPLEMDLSELMDGSKPAKLSLMGIVYRKSIDKEKVYVSIVRKQDKWIKFVPGAKMEEVEDFKQVKPLLLIYK